MTEEIKKSYNPFKMRGSWIGALIVILYGFFQPLLLYLIDVIRLSSDSTKPIFQAIVLDEWVCRFLFMGCVNEFEALEPIFFYTLIIIGFLMGWGIHSFIRRIIK